MHASMWGKADTYCSRKTKNGKKKFGQQLQLTLKQFDTKIGQCTFS